MTITLHRSSCNLYRGDESLCSWTRWSFEPSRCAMQTTPSGFDKIRSASVPVLVSVPVGSKLFRDDAGRTWLIVYFNPNGLDATSVAHLARLGTRGIRMVDVEVTA